MKTRTALVLAVSLIIAGLLFFANMYINDGITINHRGAIEIIDYNAIIGLPLLLAGFLILLALFLSWFGKWADAHSQAQKKSAQRNLSCVSFGFCVSFGAQARAQRAALF